MWSEVKCLLWLQWKLTRSILRGRRADERLRILGLLSRVLSLVFSLPLFLLMGAGLAVGLILLSAPAAYEVAMMVNTFLFGMWLVLPTSYSSQLVERFEMSRLFFYPIRFRSIVVGSTLISLLTMTGLWTVPLLAGQVIGLAWHQPLGFLVIALGALPTFALLALTGRVMDDLFDLVASDRRLRALVLGVLTLPFVLCWVGQYTVQFAVHELDDVADVARIPFLDREMLTSLDQASGPSEFLEILRPSRLLVWLPPGWTTAGMALVVRGEWVRGLAFLALSVASVGLLLWAHAGITRRLMQGAALRVATPRVRSRRWWVSPPGPPTLWAVFRKDWIYLWRSPMPRRLILSTVLMSASLVFPLRAVTGSDPPAAIRAALPLLAGAFAVTFVGMIPNLSITANYFGTIDREGFATLAFTGLDRRMVLMAANLTMLVYAGLQYLVLALVIGLVTRAWAVVPLVLFLGLCLQIGGTPAYNLAAIIGPYRAQLKFSGGRQRGNLWGLLAWLVSAPPVLILTVLPYVLWRPALVLTLPLGLVYSVGLYALTLKPLAQLLARRESQILRAVTSED
jgi:hypothetical protein